MTDSAVKTDRKPDGSAAAKTGFALGGLAGFNAHGVGFLQAAKTLDIRPSIISCTSGMVVWAAEYLAGSDLVALLQEQIRDDHKFPPPLDWMNSLWIACFGDPGIFRPAIPEYWARWFSPPGAAAAPPERHRRPVDSVAEAYFNRLLPAQVYVPTRPRDQLERYADILRTSAIPVVFNTFHPTTGRTYLHINDAARDFLGVRYGEVGGADKYLPIDTEAVSGALWLYLYGFDRNSNPHGLVDGAYVRQFIISELHNCDRIYAVRPQNARWIGDLPQNYFENEDFTTEMWLNSSYYAEVNQITTINRLIETGKLQADGYHVVDVVPVQVQRQYGYFNFFVESRQVYEASLHQSLHTLRHAEAGTGTAAPAEAAAAGP